MVSALLPCTRGPRLLRARLAALALFLACLAPPVGLASEPATCPTCPEGHSSALPGVPQKSPRPLEGPESVPSFIDSLTTNDARFEVLVGQGRILTVKEDLTAPGKTALIAVGDPSILDVVVVSRRQIRVVGLRLGMTDLSVTTSDGRTYSFEVRIVADLDVLRGQLQCLFPDARLKLCQLRENIVVEGQARDQAQVGRIMETIRAYVAAVQTAQARSITATQARGPVPPATAPAPRPADGTTPETPAPVVGPRPTVPTPPGGVSPEQGGPTSVQGTIGQPQIINLIRVPTSQQVLLKVRVAELNRTGLRQIGSDFLAVDPSTGAIIGTQIGGASITAVGAITNRTLKGTAAAASSGQTTAFGIFEQGSFELFFSALRRNSLLKILAEPNLVTMNGHQANFLAGGEFPVPVPQFSGTGGASATTIQFQQFGVSLAFLPFVLDNEVIRLTVDPEVSEIDFAIATTLVPGGSPVPGLATRKAHTTVEMRQGQTLAIAGLLQLNMTGNTARIPGLGDLPIIGPLFSNTSSTQQEKELIVLVTPYLIEPMNPDQVPPSPGDEVNAPNDLEFFFLNRLQGRTGRDFRSTLEYDDALHVLRCYLRMEKEHIRGAYGFCE